MKQWLFLFISRFPCSLLQSYVFLFTPQNNAKRFCADDKILTNKIAKIVKIRRVSVKIKKSQNTTKKRISLKKCCEETTLFVGKVYLCTRNSLEKV